MFDDIERSCRKKISGINLSRDPVAHDHSNLARAPGNFHTLVQLTTDFS